MIFKPGKRVDALMRFLVAMPEQNVGEDITVVTNWTAALNR